MKGANLAAIALLAAALFWPQLKAHLPLERVWPRPTPAVPAVPAPDAEALKAVANVQGALKENPLRGKFAAYFRTFATVIEQHPDDFRTVGQLIAQHRVASSAFIKLEPGGVAQLNVHVDAAIKAMLGDEDKSIDQAAALRAVRALAWACQ